MATSVSTVLGLQLPTDPRWINLAEKSLDFILTDHAWCEQKAATSCISLIQRYSGRKRLVNELSPVVTEEWGHFRLVLSEINKRSFVLGPQRKDEYVNRLRTHLLRGGKETDRLLDQLLICALVEARSCERFRLLSEGLEDAYLRNFYRRFMESEAGHYTLFISLANEYLPRQKVKERWKNWLKIEAEIMEHIHIRGDRMH